MKSDKNLEVEVKFLVEDRAALRERLAAAGAVLKRERVYERNVRLDTADGALVKRWQLLRLRQDTAVTLTFKGPAPQDTHSEAKVREELEIEVSDFDTAVHIFQRLGLHPQQVYEKYRETFQLENVEIVLDEMPFGSFIELEGPEAAIKTWAQKLGFNWQNRILTNYLSLMLQLKIRHNLPFDDLTFANFENTDATAADILPQVTA